MSSDGVSTVENLKQYGFLCRNYYIQSVVLCFTHCLRHCTGIWTPLSHEGSKSNPLFVHPLFVHPLLLAVAFSIDVTAPVLFANSFVANLTEVFGRLIC